ncbi:DUF2628 domain-containing protein [Rhizobium sp. ARZ01]|uniref:DUF2628 domain-containing protein n=1 Tax=Rhizobium sp. ARZ01 TaxID=2769313 RepID=UPI001781734A|nr:DUF2628 domain-containing protein [Rhizobium sp. ARZ01]MBD9374431.1 DUF2628 domain-containing protein [Rhizobium sp. ARZ01]
MTASYLILTPPGAPAAAENATFIRDGFRWTAFFFPVPWLLVHRLWFWGIIALVLQVAASILTDSSELAAAGFTLALAVSLLTALEGPQVLARSREARNWTLRSIVSARDLQTAEQIYYSAHATPEKPASAPTLPIAGTNTKAGSPPALGLLGYDGE